MKYNCNKSCEVFSSRKKTDKTTECLLHPLVAPTPTSAFESSWVTSQPHSVRGFWRLLFATPAWAPFLLLPAASRTALPHDVQDHLPTQLLCSVSLSPAAGRWCAAAPVLTVNSHKVQFSHSSQETRHKFLLPCPSSAGIKLRFTRPQAALLTVLVGVNRHGQPGVLHSIIITNTAVSEDSLFHRNVSQMLLQYIGKKKQQPTDQTTHKKHHHTTQPHIFRPVHWSNTLTSFPPAVSLFLQSFTREYEGFAFTFSLSHQPHARMKGCIVGALLLPDSSCHLCMAWLTRQASWLTHSSGIPCTTLFPHTTIPGALVMPRATTSGKSVSITHSRFENAWE